MIKEISKEDIKKILVIKLRGIGDVILSTVVLDNLRSDFPDAQIDFLTEKPSKEALKHLPQLNSIVLFDRKSTFERIKLMFRIRKSKYDLILDLFSNPSTAQITYLSRAPYRCGFPYKGRKYAYNYFGPEERDQLHSADLHLEFLNKCGLSSQSNNLHFGIAKDDLSFASDYLNSTRKTNDLLICLSPSGGWESKKCDPEKFAEIGQEIMSSYSCSLFILWGPGDKAEAEKIKEIMGDDVYLAPPTTIGQMAASLKLSDAVIANDSGPMHISTSVGTPTLSLHGPTNPLLQGPYGSKHEWTRNESLDCIECNLLDCPKNHECFRELSLADVMSKFDNMLKKNNLI